MKKIYEEGNHICVIKRARDIRWGKLLDWGQSLESWLSDNLQFGADRVQLIHRKHADILDAYLDGCEIYWYNKSRWNVFNDDFIASYKEELVYTAVPKSQENCYCEANELHYNKLEFMFGDSRWRTDISYKYLTTPNTHEIDCLSSVPEAYKQIEWNQSINNWTYCPKETEDGQHSDTISTDNSSLHMSTDSTIPTTTEINNFEEYGFTADFEGTIFGEYKNGGYHAKVTHRGEERFVVFSKEGKCFDIYVGNKELIEWDRYNLTPIVKEVYPMFKKSLITDTIFRLDSDEEYVVVLSKTLEEVGAEYSPMSDLEDVKYDSERGLYHGQPCFINWHETHRVVYYIGNGIFKDRYQEYIEGFGEFASYSQIPLEAIKTLPFIWEQYSTLSKN